MNIRSMHQSNYSNLAKVDTEPHPVKLRSPQYIAKKDRGNITTRNCINQERIAGE